MEVPQDILREKMLLENGVNRSDDGGLKEHQPALSVDGQIENLISLGLKIDNREEAQRILNSVSYFRLIKAYGVGLKPRNGEFDGDVSLEDIVALYNFNAEFRQLLFTQIERVEVTLRCRLANYFCIKYGVLGYEDAENCANADYHSQFMKESYDAITYNKRSPFIRNFQMNYSGHGIPFYALVEILSFGTLSKFFKNMKNCDKKAIGNIYGNNWTYLESWFECLAYVRNICAHYGRLYDVRLDKTPKFSKIDKGDNSSTIRVFSAIYCIKKLVPMDSNWAEFLVNIKKLFEKYPNASLQKVGFSEDWWEMLSS